MSHIVLPWVEIIFSFFCNKIMKIMYFNTFALYEII